MWDFPLILVTTVKLGKFDFCWWYWICSTITVMTSLVALSFYGASQLKFHWVERYDKLLVGSVLCLVGALTLIFHDHDHDHEHGDSTAQLHRKLIVLWGLLVLIWESTIECIFSQIEKRQMYVEVCLPRQEPSRVSGFCSSPCSVSAHFRHLLLPLDNWKIKKSSC